MRWWEAFFSDGWVKFHLAYRSPELALAEAEAIRVLVGARPGDRLLDAPCGPGDHAVILADRGISVTGFDRSEALLDAARARPGGERVSWCQGDLLALPFGPTFDHVVCAWGSFGYFSDEENEEMFAGFARALRPGGRLLLDGQTVESVLPRFSSRSWIEAGGVLVTEARSFDALSGRMDSRWAFYHDGKVENREASMRLYSVAELTRLLRRLGFAGFELYGSLEGGRFGIGALRTVIVTTRVG